MKKFLYISVVIFATVALQAAPVLSLETESSFNAIDLADFSWNTQFFLNDGNGNQYSVGPGFDDVQDVPVYGNTTWTSSNPISITYNTGVDVTANAGETIDYPVTNPFNELWVVVQDNTPVGSFFPGDFLGLENISVTINGDTLSPSPGNIQVFPDNGFSVFKVSTSATNPALISTLSLSANLTQEHGGAVGKDWTVSAYGVIPEPSTIVLMTISLIALCAFKKFRF